MQSSSFNLKTICKSPQYDGYLLTVSTVYIFISFQLLLLLLPLSLLDCAFPLAFSVHPLCWCSCMSARSLTGLNEWVACLSRALVLNSISIISMALLLLDILRILQNQIEFYWNLDCHQCIEYLLANYICLRTFGWEAGPSITFILNRRLNLVHDVTIQWGS